MDPGYILLLSTLFYFIEKGRQGLSPNMELTIQQDSLASKALWILKSVPTHSASTLGNRLAGIRAKKAPSRDKTQSSSVHAV